MPEQAQESSFGAVMRKLVNYILLFLGIESLTNYVLPRARANACSEAHSSLVVLVLDV